MKANTKYQDFLKTKQIKIDGVGIDDVDELNSMLFLFQKNIVKWALKKGRAAIFADCGLGKTPMQLEWADQIVKKTNKNVLILTPLSVGHQTEKEAQKFGIEAKRSVNGSPASKITITNYEKLHIFNKNDYVAVVCDESSILKNFQGTRRKMITEFMRHKKYRLLCTATAAPNDYTEMGTSAEALGVMGHVDMLNRFFKNEQNNTNIRGREWGSQVKWRFKNHAVNSFWRWVCLWATSLRMPSDLGFKNDGFVLPKLIENETILDCFRPLLNGNFFPMPACGLREQREEMRATLQERCEKVAEKINGSNDYSVAWCNLNDEGDLLEKMIPGSYQVKGSMPDDKKEEYLTAFSNGEIKILITKPKIGGFGLNWQHCNHMTFFPSHSYEQYYQCLRRAWRFGQERPVTVDIIATQGYCDVLKNLKRKAIQADDIFNKIVKFMNEAEDVHITDNSIKKVEVPSWLN